MDALTQEKVALALAALFIFLASLGLRWLLEQVLRPKDLQLTRPDAHVIDFWAWRRAQQRKDANRSRSTNP